MKPASKIALGIALALAYPGFGAIAVPPPPLTMADGRSLVDLSLEELSEVVVTSVSRREQSLLDAAASVYIISGDAIRRLGATTLPEALRLAPNLQVAAIDGRQYAITARGFNDSVANKLLVLVDGRTIYSPLFSGVFWDAQDFVPEDIERIEVISGAAGATWGTNAVNGVINVVTKSAAATQGPAIGLTWASREQTAVARHGFSLENGLAVRAHVKGFQRDTSLFSNGTAHGDASKGTSLGLRADWSDGDDAVMLSAGILESRTDGRALVSSPNPLRRAVEIHSSHLVGRWTRRLSDERNFDVQAYVDSAMRKDDFLLQDEADIVDIETKYRHTLGRHRWLAGLGLRHGRDHAKPGLLFAFYPATKEQSWVSAFAQDEIELAKRLSLTLGLRMERNSYTGWEALPNARLGWRLDDETLLWAALSRAVRSPSRFDRELFFLPQPPFIIGGGPNFVSEIAWVAEGGYRKQWGAKASVSVTAFQHDYDRLRSSERVAPGQTVIANMIEGRMQGLEAWGHWQPWATWRIDGGLLLMNKKLRLKPGSTDTAVGLSNLGNDPEVQASVRSTLVIGQEVDLGVALRHVGKLAVKGIPSYMATDFTLNWMPRKHIRLTAGVRDAFDKGHLEFQGFASMSETPRTAFVSISYSLP